MPTATELHIRKATVEDLDAVVELLHDAYDWLIAQGITDQWIQRFSRGSIEQIIDRDEVYVAISGEGVIATFTLTYCPDPEFWDDPSADAGYIRRLVVDRRYAGQDLGGQLLDFATQLVAAAGREWLRLDCAKYNTRLQDYYRSHGFQHLGTVDLEHRQSGALFQRSTAASTTRGVPTPLVGALPGR
ncbi:MAG: GNAT family N-acetyltransferase [Conexibacteraceae bacterium]|nr:GNAT family N-acetyltransferase [Conexibacteraceae bacterium]